MKGASVDTPSVDLAAAAKSGGEAGPIADIAPSLQLHDEAEALAAAARLSVSPAGAAASEADEAAVDEKPFRLAKHFSLIAIVLIFAVSLTLAAVVSRQAELIITTRVEDDTIKLMDNLSRQMYSDFLEEAYVRFGEIRLRDPEQQELLTQVITKTIYGFDIRRVIIYDLDGRVVYATDATIQTSRADDMASFLEAIRLYLMPPPSYSFEPPVFFPINRSGEPKTDDEPQVIDIDDRGIFLEQLRGLTVLRYEGGSFLFLNFFPQGDFVLRSYKAMDNMETYGRRVLSGVLEINRDLTAEYKQIAKLQYFAMSVAAFLALLLTIALRWVVSRGEAIINKRNQERQMLQERLGQAERLAGLGSMVATVAHEIRNPLGIIHSTADLLNRFLAEEQPDRARLARAIVEEADRLSEVVTEFLDFARPQTPRLAPMVVEEQLEELLAFLEVTLARAGVEVRTLFREDQTPINGDASMLHRAFLNILANAVQAMDDGGLLTVATSEEEKNGEKYLMVAISDTGPGLSEEAAKKIFSPFYTTKAKGTGLGLIIVKNIIDAHEGGIAMISGAAPEDESEDGGGPGLTVLIRLKF
ncbi:hypothetical protein C4J81_03915 [Deltaproteobacteria bacterium Smac51]|nr:hypothetical protein C4J81_03915 [Deltaproteobacteria bacterium Smac51]